MQKVVIIYKETCLLYLSLDEFQTWFNNILNKARESEKPYIEIQVDSQGWDVFYYDTPPAYWNMETFDAPLELPGIDQ